MYGQVDERRPATESDIGEASYVAAENTAFRAGADCHSSIGDIGRNNQGIDQLR